jgi:hypothetical protein
MVVTLEPPELNLLGVLGAPTFSIPPVLGVPHFGRYPGICSSASAHGKSSRLTLGSAVAVACGTAVAVDPAGAVAVAGGTAVAVDPAGAVAAGAGDVAAGAGDVGVAESPAHARATNSISPASIAIIGLVLYALRNITCCLPKEMAGY